MRTPAALAALGLLLAPPSAGAAETLHNGIVLAEPWPPASIDLVALWEGRAKPPWLTAPPEVIPISVGRQLFVDDFLIERMTLKRTSHAVRYHPGNPVLRPDQAWEQKGEPTAMVFSDGVWFDPADRLFKMWYMGGSVATTCLATSRDGVQWEKPAFSVQPGTNIVHGGTRDSTTVWLDHATRDPGQRFKLWRSHRLKTHWGLSLHFSPDGIAWSAPVQETALAGDRSTVHYDPFRAKWIYSLRHGWGVPRLRRYWEVSDLLQGPQWTQLTDAPLWTGADLRDAPRADLGETPQLYNLDAVGYESLTVGLFTIWRGQPTDRPKPNEVCVGFSRDGFHWTRASHEALIPVSETKGDWNWGNVQSASGCFLIVGDELWFYVSSRAGAPGGSKSGRSSTGLATLRRDGFVSLDAGADGAEVLTRPLQFTGRHLFVNAELRAGELRAEVQDAQGRVVPGFEAESCVPMVTGSTRHELKWRDTPDLGRLAGQTVRLRFVMKNGSIYSFWITPDPNGASRGATAAGGPGLTGMWDLGK